MEERELKGLCYCYDEKYFLGHKFKEKKLLWPFHRKLEKMMVILFLKNLCLI
jgi:hypothetical protein